MRRRKEKSHDGIYIKEKEIVLAEAGKKNILMHSLIQLLFIEAIAYSVLFSVVTGLGLEINVQWLIGAVLISGVLSFGIFTIPKFSAAVLLPIVATYIYAGYRMWFELQNGFWLIENRFILLMNKYYEINSYSFLVDDVDAVFVITLFLIFITIPLALLTALVIMDKIYSVVYYLYSIPFIILPFSVGMIPDTFPFAIYIAVTFGMFVLGSHIKKPSIKRPSIKCTKEERKHRLRRSKQADKSKYYINLRSSFMMFTGVLLLFLLTSRFLTLDIYEQKMDVVGVKSKIRIKVERFQVKDLADYFSFLNDGKVVIFQYSNSRGGLNEGKLGRVGKLTYDNKTDIIINALENDTSVYLRGFTGSIYNGSSWKGLSDEAKIEYKIYKSMWEKAGLSAGNQTGQLLDLLAYMGQIYSLDAGFNSLKMDIQNVDANRNYLYTPYYSYIKDNNELDVSNPEYIKADSVSKKYSIDYVPSEKNESLLNKDFKIKMETYMGDVSKVLSYSSINPEELRNKLEDYTVIEEDYRKFIYKYYTQVPDTGLEKLKADMAGKYEEMINRFGEKEALNALSSYIRTYIQKDTSYSLSPGTLPDNKDFVEYFLYEKKLGFCTHYASAATAAFRLAGIPARYVEGYVAKPEEIKKSKMLRTYSTVDSGTNKKEFNIREVRISDTGAHSWVEVYKDGWGWIPVEMTPGFQSNQEDSVYDELQTTPTPTATPSPSTTAVPTATPQIKEEDSDTKTIENKNGKKEVSAADIAVFYLSVVLMSVLLIITISILAKAYRRVLYNRASKAKKIIIIYRKVRYLLKALGIALKEDYETIGWQLENKLKAESKAEFAAFLDLALKARFGYASMTGEELVAAENYYRKIKTQAYGSIPIIKRIFYRLIWL